MRTLLALLLLLAAVVPHARADSRQALGLDDMIDLSEEIVVGEVGESAARWMGTVIVTDTTVRVGEPLKGAPPQEMTITQLGGTAVHPRLGVPVSMEASTFTALRSGESVVLFVDRRNGVRRLVGAQQGKLVLHEEPLKAPSMAVGPHVLRAVPEVAPGAVTETGMTLDELRARIRAHEAHP